VCRGGCKLEEGEFEGQDRIGRIASMLFWWTRAARTIAYWLLRQSGVTLSSEKVWGSGKLAISDEALVRGGPGSESERLLISKGQGPDTRAKAIPSPQPVSEKLYIDQHCRVGRVHHAMPSLARTRKNTPQYCSTVLQYSTAVLRWG
jgi:hypothetical protein